MVPPGFVAKALVEAAEVRQFGHIVHQGLDPFLERGTLLLAAIAQTLVDVLRQLQQHPDEQGDIAARVVDVRLQQHAVAGRLVELDVVLFSQNFLQLRTVEARLAAHQRDARRIEKEFIVPDALRGIEPGRSRRRKSSNPLARNSAGTSSSLPSTLKYFEMIGWLLICASDLEGDLNRIRNEAVALKLHLPAGDVETGDELLVRDRRSVGEDSLVKLFFDRMVVDVLHQDHRALADRRHRLVRRVRLIDAEPHLARIGNEARVQKGFGARFGAQFPLLPLVGFECLR